MSKVRFDLKNKNSQQISDFAESLVGSSTANSSVAALAEQITALEAMRLTAQKAIDRSASGDQQAAMDRQNRITAVDALKQGIVSFASAVEGVTAGDAAKILSTGFAISGTPTPLGPLGQVQNLSLTPSDHDGALDLHWAPIYGTDNYQVQITTNPQIDAGWKLETTSSRSKCELAGQPSRTRLWVRVRAMGGSTGQGPWSEPASKTVP